MRYDRTSYAGLDRCAAPDHGADPPSSAAPLTTSSPSLAGALRADRHHHADP